MTPRNSVPASEAGLCYPPRGGDCTVRYVMSARLQILLAAFAVLVALPVSLAAGATEYDGKYTGQMACDAIPGTTVKALRIDFLLRITDGRGQYEREVLSGDLGTRTGIFERGSGTVSPSGEAVLTGSAGGQGWKYDAIYRGQIAGKNLRLAGTQQWTQRAGATTYARPCTITLARTDS